MLANEKSFSQRRDHQPRLQERSAAAPLSARDGGRRDLTGSFTLVDGTRVRLPFRGWYLPDGCDMENNGAVPDLLVPVTPADEAAGATTQLDAP